jgi:molybdenum cofactor cytidylyltransferase
LPLSITGVLLAAGSGSRFGGGKLLHPLSGGIPIGVASLRNLKNALAQSVAVVRAGDRHLREQLEQEGVVVHECADAHLGMGHSLACAIRAASDSDGWVIALGDMPYLRPATISLVARHLDRPASIAQPSYRGERGHPVGFGRRYRDELLALAGDEGARTLIKRYAAEVHVLDCDDPGILRDVDRKEDLAAPPAGHGG